MIKNQELANQIMLVMNTMVELSEEMKLLLESRQIEKFKVDTDDLHAAIKAIGDLALMLKEEEEGLILPAAIKSVEISLLRIVFFVENDNIKKAIHKIEFELIPLIEEMRINFYYFGIVYPDKKKIEKYISEDVYQLGRNRYVVQSMESGKYKYDISIIVLAYNKREITQICLQNLYKNLPQDIRYEIILCNHGSDDGTKELFEQYNPNKQMDIAVNGGGVNAVYRITEGKYIILVSNDVVVTKNAIENMYKCIQSDDKIAWVVPTTPNVSNLQTISVQYSNYEEMHQFASQNNHSDFTRWEQRVRLCNPIDVESAEVLEKTQARNIFHSRNMWSFSDDKMSLIFRRNGYKMYLAKDAYCHHFGSVTLKEDEKTNSALAFQKGRIDFKKFWGIDPWAPSLCYDASLFLNFSVENKENIRILGIECGMGSNPLKLKEILNEKFANQNCYLKMVTSNEEFLSDEKGVSNEVELIQSHEDIKKLEGEYDYIVNEYEIECVEDFEKELRICKKFCIKDGTIIFLLRDNIVNIIEDKLDNKFNIYNSIRRKDLVWLVYKN